MSAARASVMDLASSLKRNTFLTLEVHPAGGPPYRRSPNVPRTDDMGSREVTPPRGATLTLKMYFASNSTP